MANVSIIKALDPETNTVTAYNINDSSAAHNTATGKLAISIDDATASGNYSTALGPNAKTTVSYTTAIGYYSNASATYASALGARANASGSYSTALGRGANASSEGAAALGYNSLASGYKAVALGQDSIASGTYSTALGVCAEASGNNSTALGDYAEASGNKSTALGEYANASGINSTALGWNTIASAYCSTALGYGANASGSHSIAIGEIDNVDSNTVKIRADNGMYIARYSGVNGVTYDEMFVPLIQYGSLVITPSAANTPTYSEITFDIEYHENPIMMVTPLTSTPGTVVLGAGFNGVSTTGCNIWITRTNTNNTTVHWVAIGY